MCIDTYLTLHNKQYKCMEVILYVNVLQLIHHKRGYDNFILIGLNTALLWESGSLVSLSSQLGTVHILPNAMTSRIPCYAASHLGYFDTFRRKYRDTSHTACFRHRPAGNTLYTQTFGSPEARVRAFVVPNSTLRTCRGSTNAHK